MPRNRTFSDSLLAAVRQYFCLDQEHLAEYLGVSRGLIAHLEAGRRQLSGPLYDRLQPLLRQMTDAPMPAVLTAATIVATPPPAAPAPAVGPLEARLDYCQHEANRLRRAARPYIRRARYAARWRAALPALLAELPPRDPTLPDYPAASADRATLRAWKLNVHPRLWLQQVAAPDLSATEIAEWHLLLVRAAALDTEAAALRRLLNASAPA